MEKIADLKPGMVLEGVVTNVAAFGAFVDVGVHQDGLVHVSAMSKTFVKDPREVVKSGDVVRVKVLDVDVPRKRISLTLRLDDEAERGRRARRPGRRAPRAWRRQGGPRGGRARSRGGQGGGQGGQRGQGGGAVTGVPKAPRAADAAARPAAVRAAAGAAVRAVRPGRAAGAAGRNGRAAAQRDPRRPTAPWPTHCAGPAWPDTARTGLRLNGPDRTRPTRPGPHSPDMARTGLARHGPGRFPTRPGPLEERRRHVQGHACRTPGGTGRTHADAVRADVVDDSTTVQATA